jgi:hypothetical protein
MQQELKKYEQQNHSGHHKDLRGLEQETMAWRTLRAGETNSASVD